jgi:orotidine 5'-phosphate decarboxylase subfamily 1
MNNPLTRKLLSIRDEKKTNLCIAADGMSIEKTLRLIEKVGNHICILKIHSRQFGDDKPHKEYMERLYEYKKKYNFLLFEDAKFFDGAETVRLDYESHFAKYVDIVTVVPLGDDILKAIARGAKNAQLPDDEPRGCLAVCELSFANIIPLESEKYLEVAQRNSDICIGFIGQKLPKVANMIKAVPGVNLQNKTDGVNQQWRTPDQIKGDGADIFIVGRGVTSYPESEWESLAVKYKELCYS